MTYFICRLCGYFFFKFGKLNRHILGHFGNCVNFFEKKTLGHYSHLNFLIGTKNTNCRVRTILEKKKFFFSENFFLFLKKIKKNFSKNIRYFQNKILTKFLQKKHNCLKTPSL